MKKKEYLKKAFASLDRIEKELITGLSDNTPEEERDEAPTKVDQSVLTMPEE